MIHEHSAGSIIYRKDGDKIEFLIVESCLHHTWGFPKGHLEPGETEEEAAKREVAEEVGLHPEFDFNFRCETTYPTEEGTVKKVGFFLSENNSDQHVVDQKEEILNSKWVDLQTSKSYLPEARGLYNMLVKAEDFIKQNN